VDNGKRGCEYSPSFPSGNHGEKEGRPRSQNTGRFWLLLLPFLDCDAVGVNVVQVENVVLDRKDEKRRSSVVTWDITQFCSNRIRAARIVDKILRIR